MDAKRYVSKSVEVIDTCDVKQDNLSQVLVKE